MALSVVAIAWPPRKRLERRPLALMWLVLGLFAGGRFLELFLRSDSGELALGVEIAQWASLLRLAVVAAAPADPRPPAHGGAHVQSRRTTDQRTASTCTWLRP
jgi:hypothetical protein